MTEHERPPFEDESTPNLQGNPNPGSESVTIPVTKATKVIGLILGLAAIIVPSATYIDGRYEKLADAQQFKQQIQQGLTAVEIQVLESKRAAIDNQVFELERLERKGELDNQGQIRLRELKRQLQVIDRQIMDLYGRK